MRERSLAAALFDYFLQLLGESGCKPNTMIGKLACIVIVEATLRLSKVIRGAGLTAPIFLIKQNIRAMVTNLFD